MAFIDVFELNHLSLKSFNHSDSVLCRACSYLYPDSLRIVLRNKTSSRACHSEFPYDKPVCTSLANRKLSERVTKKTSQQSCGDVLHVSRTLPFGLVHQLLELQPICPYSWKLNQVTNA